MHVLFEGFFFNCFLFLMFVLLLTFFNLFFSQIRVTVSSILIENMFAGRAEENFLSEKINKTNSHSVVKLVYFSLHS